MSNIFDNILKKENNERWEIIKPSFFKKYKKKQWIDLLEIYNDISTIYKPFLINIDSKKGAGKSFAFNEIFKKIDKQQGKGIAYGRFSMSEMNKWIQKANKNPEFPFFVKNGHLISKKTKEIKGFVFYIKNGGNLGTWASNVPTGLLYEVFVDEYAPLSPALNSEMKKHSDYVLGELINLVSNTIRNKLPTGETYNNYRLWFVGNNNHDESWLDTMLKKDINEPFSHWGGLFSLKFTEHFVGSVDREDLFELTKLSKNYEKYQFENSSLHKETINVIKNVDFELRELLYQFLFENKSILISKIELNNEGDYIYFANIEKEPLKNLKTYITHIKFHNVNFNSLLLKKSTENKSINNFYRWLELIIVKRHIYFDSSFTYHTFLDIIKWG